MAGEITFLSGNIGRSFDANDTFPVKKEHILLVRQLYVVTVNGGQTHST